jgi:hypothetical protein
MGALSFRRRPARRERYLSDWARDWIGAIAIVAFVLFCIVGLPLLFP